MNVVAAAGFAVMVVGLGLGATTQVSSTTAWAALWFIVAGSGLGCALPAAMNAALGALSPQRAGVGSGLIMACRQVGAAIGVAILGTVLNGDYRRHVSVLGLPAPVARTVRSGVGAGAAVAARLGDAELGRSVRVAFVSSLDAMLWVCAGIAVAATVLALVLLPGRRASTGSQVDEVVIEDVGTAVTLMANSPALSPPSVGDVVLPDATSSVHCASWATKTVPDTVTVVEVEPVPAAVRGADPVSMFDSV